MATMTEASRGASEAMLSIGALSRATGIPIDTLRTWERRYGFPEPARKPSGHRVYPMNSVPRLRRIASLVAQGHRSGDVVGASEEMLEQLAEAGSSAAGARVGGGASGDASARIAAGPQTPTIDDLLDIVRSYDGDRLTLILLGDWARLAPLEFLERRVAPLLDAVGRAWEEGTLEIRHEHFVSERIGDLLRSLRLPFEARARGGVIVLAALSGERHGLGLEMAALVLAAAGWRVLYLGTDMPVAQVSSVVRDTRARAVAVSVSSAARSDGMAQSVAQLRAELPPRVELIAGGRGAPSMDGVRALATLEELDGWARSPHGAA